MTNFESAEESITLSLEDIRICLERIACALERREINKHE